MKNILFILFIFFLNLNAVAQLDDHYFQQKDYKASLGIDLNYEFNSNSITNKFLNTYLYGTHIDSLNKQWMFANLSPDNRFGADLEGGLTYVAYPDSFAGINNTGIFVKYNKYYHVDLSFTDDLFKLFFDGNKRFAGTTADLSNSTLNVTSYDQMQFGVITKFSNNKTKQTFGIGLSINNGYQNKRIVIKDATLFTDANAEYLDFSANYKVFRSDTSHNSSTVFKGIGSSINFYYSVENRKKNIFDIELTDLGFIQWNKNSQQFSKDTAIHFEGVNVNDILNIQGNIFGHANIDSIVRAYTFSHASHSYTTPTLACLKISYLYNVSEKARMEFSIREKFFSHYDPFFMLKIQFLPDKKYILSLNLSYGGYSSANVLENHEINAGLEFAHDFGKGIMLLIGSNYLNGFIYPYSTTAQGAFFTLKKYFF